MRCVFWGCRKIWYSCDAMIQTVSLSGRVFALNFSFLLHFESTECVTWCTACRIHQKWQKREKRRDSYVYGTPENTKKSTTICRMFTAGGFCYFFTLLSPSCRLLSLLNACSTMERDGKKKIKTLFALKFNLLLRVSSELLCCILRRALVFIGKLWALRYSQITSWLLNSDYFKGKTVTNFEFN
jgi:hypothetical protein